MLKKITTKLADLMKIKKYQKIMAVFFGIFVFGGVFLAMQPSSAGPGTYIGNALIQGITWMCFGLSAIFIRIAVFALEFFLELAQYNDFINAPPVVMGWLIMRDLANMFFVVALLVIAFGTILGLEQYEWQRSLVKLILVAIFINFSKLILQLIIDGVHVFTVTFLNAVSNSAGQNLINMLKMSEVIKMVSPGAGGFAGVATSDSLELGVFAASVMAAIMSGMTMLIIGAYMIILLARMVVLWILIILSPLAFVASTFPSGKRYSQQFWDKFVHHVMVAPVMVFFLWLSFASLGAGNIAAQINVSPSAVAQAGEVLGEGSDLSNTPYVSLSEASTWNNLSSFAIALGFLMVGITFVQSLGVVGGSMTQSAVRFGTSVATIASGYAAGRWLVGKGTETGKEYGRLAWGATGDRLRHLEGVRNIPILGAASAVKRKAAVERLEKFQRGRIERYKAEGPTGLAAMLAPSKEKLAALEHGTEYIRGRKEKEEARFRAESSKEMFKNDHEAFAVNKIQEIQARLNINFETLDKTEQNKNLLKHYEEYKKQLSVKPAAAVDSVQDLENELMKDERYKDKYTNQTRRDVDRKSAKGTFMIAKELEEQYAEEQVGDEESRRREIDGLFKYGYQKSEAKTFAREFDNTTRDLVIQKILVKSDEEISKITETDRQALWKGIEEDKRFEILNSLSKAEIARAFEKKGKFNDLAKIGGIFEEYRSQRRLNKYKTEAEAAKQAVASIARAMEGKSSDQVRRNEMRMAMDMLEDFKGYSYQRYEDEVKEGYNALKALKEEIAQKKSKGESAVAEEDRLSSNTQRQAQLVSAFKKDFVGSFSGLIASLHASFKNVTLNNETAGKMEAAIITGSEWEDVEKSENFSRIEDEMHKLFKEKDGRLFRLIKMVNDSSATEHNFAIYGGQVLEGKNEYGNTRLGYAQNMKQKLGEDKKLGTGTVKSGEKERQDFISGNVLPFISNKNTKDARALYNMKGSKAAGVHSAAGLKTLRTAISTGEGLDSEVDKRVILGGTVVTPAWDGAKFNMEADVQKAAALGYGDFIRLYNSSQGEIKNRMFKQIKKDLSLAGVNMWKDRAGNSIKISDATVKQISEFINDNIIEGVKGSQHDFAPDEKIERLEMNELQSAGRRSGGQL